MFYALAIVCDDFFVPSLEKICEVRGKDLGPFGKSLGEGLGVIDTWRVGTRPRSTGAGSRPRQRQGGAGQDVAWFGFC